MARYLFFIWFLFSISFASQSEEISLYANSIDSLIDVESDLDFSSLLPNYDYTGTLKISWGIPEKSLEKAVRSLRKSIWQERYAKKV